MKSKIPLELAAPGDGGFHLLCNVHINRTNIRALIDTGASRSILSVEGLSLLNLAASGGISSMGIGAAPLQAQTVRIDLTFKKIKLKSFEVGVLDMSHISEAYQELGIAPFQFILGGDLLHLFQGQIDYPQKTLKIKWSKTKK